MKFTKHLWQEIIPVYQQILNHPFIDELAKGTLDESRFIFYMEQDAYYLRQFSRTLAMVAGRADTAKMIHQFNLYALGAMEEVNKLHAHYVRNSIVEPSPACLAYTDYLLAKAVTAPLEEAISALLPCFWIYRDVGRHISKKSLPGNRYQQWIDNYSSLEFSEVTDQMIVLVDELADCCTLPIREGMKSSFNYAALYEWHFWNDAYRLNKFTHSIKQQADHILAS